MNTGRRLSLAWAAALVITLFPAHAHANMVTPVVLLPLHYFGIFCVIFAIAVSVRITLVMLKRLTGNAAKQEERPEGAAAGGKKGCFGAFRREAAIASVVSLLLTGYMAWWERSPASSFRTRAKTSEAKSNLGAIRSLQTAYFAENGRYVGDQPPAPLPDRRKRREKVAWDPDTRFSILGFAPEGEVYFSYSLEGPGWPSEEQGFTARAYGDLDGDGKLSIYTITSSSAEITHTGDDR